MFGKMDRDQGLLIALKFVRMVAYGQTTMVLVPFLLNIKASDQQIGWFMALTLFGDVALSAVVTAIADRWGRRRMLVAGSAAMIVSGLVFAACENFWILLLAAIVGVISPSGDEVGPFRAIEESTLAHLTVYHHRPRIYAWQNLFGTLGLAFGALTAGFLEEYVSNKTGSATKAYQVMFQLYSVLAAVCLVLNALLSVEAELKDEPPQEEAQPVPETEEAPLIHPQEQALQDAARPKVTLTFSLSFLFGIDSLAYGFMTNSWVVEYMERTFKTSPRIVGQFFFVGCFIAAMTSLPSAALTHRIGPVLAIVLTKIGAASFAGIVPLARVDYTAMGFLLLRSLFDTMDVVPRQVFITSIVSSGQRTQVLGQVNVIKTLARSVGPIFTGILAGQGYLWTCFVILAALEYVFAGLILECFFQKTRNHAPVP
ncbi:hypothetical protein B9G98_01749 [Wickerhamiella sorbophila]|uniref:Major facilitator superfamily (MFS) profile domain-containing protein n=1 Tax=Wickerhamiella sorbophila TaxID=45607 RepID=A0A2T0FGQ4_9ASCO|nr:hypothetical protein B9G98_01749 [Wickerhamiella sorbophila]PRT54129.1 hypothetical protein B9G98_01749 [Wickerhamiella sorbophila]